MVTTLQPKSEISLRVKLSQEAQQKLAQGAAQIGGDVDAYASELIEVALTRPSIDELLAPFRKQVAESGMDDDELDAFHENLRDKLWKDSKGLVK